MATIPETMSSHEIIDPPPYTPPAYGFHLDGDEDEESIPTTNFNVHAATVVHGSGNVVSIPPPDATRLAAHLFAAISQKVNHRNFTIHINCGINITGDRNQIVTGGVLRPLGANAARPQQAAVTSSMPASVMPPSTLGKRKSSEVCDNVFDKVSLLLTCIGLRRYS